MLCNVLYVWIGILYNHAYNNRGNILARNRKSLSFKNNNDCFSLFIPYLKNVNLWITGYTYIIVFRYSHINDTPTPILYGVVLLNAYKLSNNNKIGYTKKIGIHYMQVVESFVAFPVCVDTY